MMRYELERGQTLRKGRKSRDKLDELERREAFLQGRKEALLVEIRAPLEAFFTRRSKIRRTETGRDQCLPRSLQLPGFRCVWHQVR